MVVVVIVKFWLVYILEVVLECRICCFCVCNVRVKFGWFFIFMVWLIIWFGICCISDCLQVIKLKQGLSEESGMFRGCFFLQVIFVFDWFYLFGGVRMVREVGLIILIISMVLVCVQFVSVFIFFSELKKFGC